MKNLTLFLGLVTLGVVVSESPVMAACRTDADQLTLILSSVGIEEPSNSGCCSWHGGVCGCSFYGRTVCCDGTTSPSCKCNR